MSERCERGSEWTSAWPSTSVPIMIFRNVPAAARLLRDNYWTWTAAAEWADFAAAVAAYAVRPPECLGRSSVSAAGNSASFSHSTSRD